MSGAKNPLVNKPDETFEYTENMIKELYKASKDLFYFAENFVYIVHPKKGKIQFSLRGRDYQRRILNSYQDHSKLVLMAVRQCGKTTCTAIYMLWYAMFHDHKTCAVLANKDDTAKSILDDIKVMYENLPKWMKLGCHEYNAHTISFNNGSKIFCAATSKNGLAGESVSFLYMDEVALIEPATLADEFWKANLPTVSHGEKVVLTSTPRGVGNLFHRVWKEANEGMNGFHPVRADYWEVPEYQTEEWKENMIKELGGMVAFNSEYGNQFVGSQATVVGAEALKCLQSVEPTVEEKIHGGYERRWEEYDKNCAYCASADISLGSGNDYSTLQIFKLSWRSPTVEDYKEYANRDEDPPEAIIYKMEQVYLFRSNLCSIPQFVDYVFSILPQWGNPFFIVENNGIGRSFVDKMQEEHYYENAYIHEDSIDVGIDSNSKTKLEMVNYLKDMMDNGKVSIRDSNTINEIMTFVEKRSTAGNRRFQAEDGSNDDLVVGLGWACFMVQSMWMQDMLTFSI